MCGKKSIVIAPLSRISINDPDLDGSRGLNRATPNPSEPVASTDLDAAREFINTHRATPTTERNYTKEIERLILWAINVKRKAFSSLSYADMEEYIEFLDKPEPIEVWSSKRKFPRESAEWRPFVMRELSPEKDGTPPRLVAGLASSSRLTAMASLSSVFTWLVDYGYLIKNPMRQIKTKRKAVRNEQPKSAKAKVERYLDEEMWAAFLDAIEGMPRETQPDMDQYERARFIAAMMLFLAPRASELADGRMNDFRAEGGLWWWHVVGKGSKAEKIPVVDDMIRALIRYRAYLGFTPLPLDNDDSPLLRSIKDGSPITARQLNLILDNLFEAAAKLLEMKSIELPASAILGKAEYLTRAAKIRQASSHWGRHTSITFQVRSGIPKEIVQLNARHNDSRTTEGYTHEDEKHWHSEAQKLRSD